MATACADAPRKTPAPVPVTAEALRARVTDGRAPATLVNVWASWCGPCREEFPALLWLRHTHGPRGLQVLLVSADLPKEAALARRFLELHHVDFETFLQAEGDGFARGFHPEWTGAVPATFVFDRDGKLHYFVEGKVGYTLLAARVDELLPGDEARSQR